MKHALTILLSLLTAVLLPSALAQTAVYPVSSFSPEYHATITVTGNVNDVFKPGVVRVFNTRTGKPIIEVKSKELAFDVKGGKANVNVQEHPYGEQSVIIYQDFNFDGRKDLAIMDGQNSCYHGPSFQVYLGVPGGFKQNPDFTRLAQEYCGMFDVHAEAKRLNTMTKDGCCWHQFNTYSVVNNKPVLQESVEESLLSFTPFYAQATTKTRQGNQFTSKTSYFLVDEEQNRVLQFPLLNRPDKVVYVMQGNGILDYVLIEGEGQVEFGAQLAAYQQTRKDQDVQFKTFMWHASTGRLSFTNQGVTYTVIDTPGKLGVEVTQGGKTTFLPGNPKLKTGNLQNLNKLKLENLRISR